MKKSFAAYSITFLILLVATTEMFAQYTPGTYKGSAYGRSDKEHNGLVEVEVTVSADKIDDIKVVTYNQSVDHKKYGTPVNEAKTKTPAQILEKQKLDADVITDATMASTAIELAVAKALQQAVAKKYTPGTYKGSAMGREDKEHDGKIEVEVTVSADKIDDIKVLTYNQSVDHKKYGPQVNEAKTKTPAQILEKQSLDADVVTDATMASSAIELAVARALEQARVK